MRKLKRVLMSVSDKAGLIELAQELSRQGCEILASGGTFKALEERGIHARKVETFSGSPEAFQGRMKTLSFKIFSGILARRDDPADLQDREKLGIPEIDGVIVNFYPFEKAQSGMGRKELTELIDIGGPALVRAAAKNSPDVLVLTDPEQYSKVIEELKQTGGFSEELALQTSARAWERVLEYDSAIARVFGERKTLDLKYGENPHQSAYFSARPDSPVAYDEAVTPNPLSYNNILDASCAYRTLVDVLKLRPNSMAVVIVKHGNPCGVASVPANDPAALDRALELAWAGDPISAFGGVIAISHALTSGVTEFLQDRFIECVLAPDLKAGEPKLQALLSKRKGLKALRIRSIDGEIKDHRIDVVGGTLVQAPDSGSQDSFTAVSGGAWSSDEESLGRFGIAVAKNVKSNAIAIVGRQKDAFLLWGVGQGQPNRIDALRTLAVPRAKATAERLALEWLDGVLVSDAFFPFSDSIEACADFGIERVIQPGGSIRDAEVVMKAQELGIRMIFTGVRHFLH